jgi:hypothetical protein
MTKEILVLQHRHPSRYAGTCGEKPSGKELDEGCHKLFESSPLIGFDRIEFNPEFLAPGPADNRPINKHRGMVIREKDAERDYHPGLNRMRPIDPPAVEGEIPGHPASLKSLAGVIHRALYRKAPKRSNLKAGTESDRGGRRNQRSQMFVATGHHIPVRTTRLHEVGVSDGFRTRDLRIHNPAL